MIENLKGYNKIGIDPGKNSIMFMTDGKNKLDYSKMQRRKETYAKQSRINIVIFYNRNPEVKKFETQLSKFNSKSCRYDDFLAYTTEKNKVTSRIMKLWEDLYMRKQRWRRYTRKQKSESLLLNKIEKDFSKDGTKKILIGLGDWSQKSQMKGCMPTPNKSIRKLLSRNFKVVLIDEFHTSKICNICKEGETKKFFYRVKPNIRKLNKDGTRQKQLVHSLLTCKKCSEDELFVQRMEQKGRQPIRFLNRDLAASRNILYLLNQRIYNKIRPEVLCRPKKETTKLL